MMLCMSMVSVQTKEKFRIQSVLSILRRVDCQCLERSLNDYIANRLK